ncbi:DoxX family protein [Prochlorococcus sp. MIT 0916]|uniref:DoxX family protein n=1 Tax=Prochlorococcus sp. MIT 0916 TaxID=3082521 RepID=UPI0039B3ABEC
MLSTILYKTIFKDLAILLLRVFTGVLLIHHGFEKLNDINNFADAFVRPLHLPFPVTLSYIAAASEILGSWSLIIGLGTRLGASAILGTMSVAIYHALITSGFNIYLLELLALYFSSAISIIFLGPGRFSADYLINEFFINKLIQVDIKSEKKIIARLKPLKKNINLNKSKKSKVFEFPFSSFLSS